MYGENFIGKKVNLLGDFCNFQSDVRTMCPEVCEIVKYIPWSEELNDYCGHYIVRKPDGSEVEIREWDCVFSPDKEKSTTTMVYNFLKDNGIYAEVYNFNGLDACLVVYISRGDWKHDHIWVRHLMAYIGYNEVGSKVTEENGSDCYSAEHYFVKEV